MATDILDKIRGRAPGLYDSSGNRVTGKKKKKKPWAWMRPEGYAKKDEGALYNATFKKPAEQAAAQQAQQSAAQQAQNPAQNPAPVQNSVQPLQGQPLQAGQQPQGQQNQWQQQWQQQWQPQGQQGQPQQQGQPPQQQWQQGQPQHGALYNMYQGGIAQNPVDAFSTGGSNNWRQELAANPLGQANMTGLSGAESALNASLGGALDQLKSGYASAAEDIDWTTTQSTKALKDYLDSGLRGLQGAYGEGKGGMGQGLSAAAENISNALGISLEDLKAGVSQGRLDLSGLMDSFRGYAQQGQSANDLMSAQSGALGADAQQQAFDNFTASPGQQFLRDKGEQALLRNSSATGGLGGGRVLQELQKQGIGVAQQDYANQYQRLAGLADLGLNAKGQISALGSQSANMANQGGINAAGMQQSAGDRLAQNNMNYGNNLANLASQYGMNQANLQGQAGGNIASTISNYGTNAANQATQYGNSLANLLSGSGLNLANFRTQAGQQMAGNEAMTASQLANLAQQTGSGMSNLYNQQGNTLAGLLSGDAGREEMSYQQLAALLGQISSGAVGQYGGYGVTDDQTGIGAVSDGLGVVGSVVGAVGGLLSDARLKENVNKVGVIGGHNIYTWDWNDEGKRLADPGQPKIGVMAQEIMLKIPDAVTVGRHGYLTVDYRNVH